MPTLISRKLKPQTSESTAKRMRQSTRRWREGETGPGAADPDVEEAALDVGEAAELSVGEAAELSVGGAADPSVGEAADEGR
ncbi:hypothetical protein GCM10023237_58120 [Streptomyces coeruleoprunus]